MNKYYEKWDRFWFGPLPAINLAIFRFLVCVPLFFLYLNRHFFLDEFYSEAGLVPLGLASEVFLPFTEPAFVWFFSNYEMLWWAHLVYLITLPLLALGLLPRPLGFAVWILHTGFMQRNFSVVYGVDILASIWLLYLSLTSCRGVHVFAVLKDWKKAFQQQTDLLSSVGYRLIQVHLCVIYVYTGIEKLKGTTWWDGTALWKVLGNPQMVWADMSFVLAVPWAVSIVTFLTLLFEIYFPVLIWLRSWRLPLATLGFFFHMGIAFLLALPVFSTLMVATYVLFWVEGLPSRSSWTLSPSTKS